LANKDLSRSTIGRITPYSPGKPIEEVQRELGLSRIVKLASNESPLGPSPLALEAMRAAVEAVRLYPNNLAHDLTAALAEHLDQPADRVFVGRGSDEVIHMTGLAFVNPGDEIVFADPPFALYPLTAHLMDATEVRIPLRDYVHDLDAMADAITDKTKLIFIANPHNPTGTMVTADELQGFINALPEHVIACIDEAYYEYVMRDDYPRSLRWVDEGRNVIVYRTFSKIYALAGLRVGYGIVPDHLRDAMAQVRPPFNVSTVAQDAAVASLADADQVPRGRAANRLGIDYLMSEFERLGLSGPPSQANFVFVDTGRDSQELFDALLRRGYIVRTGDIFGLSTHIRVSVGTDEDNRGFIEALKQALKEVAPA
jgi:histidinol-phosphate aminotransferase